MTAISDAGFTKTRLDQRLADLESAVRSIFGADIDLGPESPDGQLLGVFAEVIADLDDLAETVYNARSAAGARGAGLSRLVQLNGITRKPAQFSTAPITLSGTPGTLVPAGSLIATTATPPDTFATITDLTIGGGGTITGQVRATVTGTINAGAGTISVIQTVISGWTAATNASAATPGSDAETDAALRLRRIASVALPSQGILDGLVAALAQLADVRHVAVYENPNDTVDANGLPPHSINAIVDGGADADIANALWLKKSMGVTQVGAQSADITDSQGRTHPMNWDQPVQTVIYLRVQLAVDVGTATRTAIKDAIVAWGQANSGIGADVIWSQLFIPINSVPGLNVLAVFIDTSPSPSTQTNITIAFNAIATWDAANIVVGI